MYVAQAQDRDLCRVEAMDSSTSPNRGRTCRERSEGRVEDLDNQITVGCFHSQCPHELSFN